MAIKFVRINKEIWDNYTDSLKNLYKNSLVFIKESEDSTTGQLWSDGAYFGTNNSTFTINEKYNDSFMETSESDSTTYNIIKNVTIDDIILWRGNDCEYKVSNLLGDTYSNLDVKNVLLIHNHLYKVKSVIHENKTYLYLIHLNEYELLNNICQSDWGETDDTSLAFIKNKPILSNVATSGSYEDLSEKPNIPTVNSGTLKIQKNNENIIQFSANDDNDLTFNIKNGIGIDLLSDNEGNLTINMDSNHTVTSEEPIIITHPDKSSNSGLVNYGIILYNIMCDLIGSTLTAVDKSGSFYTFDYNTNTKTYTKIDKVTLLDYDYFESNWSKSLKTLSPLYAGICRVDSTNSIYTFTILLNSENKVETHEVILVVDTPDSTTFTFITTLSWNIISKINKNSEVLCAFLEVPAEYVGDIKIIPKKYIDYKDKPCCFDYNTKYYWKNTVNNLSDTVINPLELLDNYDYDSDGTTKLEDIDDYSTDENNGYYYVNIIGDLGGNLTPDSKVSDLIINDYYLHTLEKRLNNTTDILEEQLNHISSVDSNSKLYLIGATSLDTNPYTYSHDTAYVGTDGCLYSNNELVATNNLLSNNLIVNKQFFDYGLALSSGSTGSWIYIGDSYLYPNSTVGYSYNTWDYSSTTGPIQHNISVGLGNSSGDIPGIQFLLYDCARSLDMWHNLTYYSAIPLGVKNAWLYINCGTSGDSYKVFYKIKRIYYNSSIPILDNNSDDNTSINYGTSFENYYFSGMAKPLDNYAYIKRIPLPLDFGLNTSSYQEGYAVNVLSFQIKISLNAYNKEGLAPAGMIIVEIIQNI